MRVTVRLFASYRETAGTSKLEIDVPDRCTVAELAAEVAARYPALPECHRLVVAVNNEYQAHEFVLSEGDEAAIIPPVSGG